MTGVGWAAALLVLALVAFDVYFSAYWLLRSSVVGGIRRWRRHLLFVLYPAVLPNGLVGFLKVLVGDAAVPEQRTGQGDKGLFATKRGGLPRSLAVWSLPHEAADPTSSQSPSPQDSPAPSPAAQGRTGRRFRVEGRLAVAWSLPGTAGVRSR